MGEGEDRMGVLAFDTKSCYTLVDGVQGILCAIVRMRMSNGGTLWAGYNGRAPRY